MLRWAERIGTPALRGQAPLGKTEDGHVVVASGTTFLTACLIQWLVIFGILIHLACKDVVLENKWLDKFFCSTWIVVYIKIRVQLNVLFCGNYLRGTFVIAGIFFVVICCGNQLGVIRCCLRYNGGSCYPFTSRRIFF